MKFDRQAFFNSYKNSFGNLTQKQVDGLGGLLNFAENDPRIESPHWFAYMLATVKHECADTYEPITERGQLSYFNKYEPGTLIASRLGNINQGDGYLFRGRGYVQITGRANYKRMTTLLKLIDNDDLILNPDRALFPVVAYKIMSFGMINGSFTGKKLGDYINSSQTDYMQARKIINALDQAEKIRGYALSFESILNDSIIANEPTTAAVSSAELSSSEKDSLFENNVVEINKMNISAGSLIKSLIMELERDSRNTYLRLYNAVPGGHIVNYELVQGDQNLILNLAHALGFKNITGELLEVRDA